MIRHESEEFKNTQKKMELEYTQLKRKERNKKYSEKKKLNENKIKKVCLESEFFGNNLISNSISNDTEIINENITYENNECIIFESETETNSDRSLNNGNLSDLSNCSEVHDEYLYEGSDISVNEFGVSLLSLKYKHKFSESAMDDILKLIKIVIPNPNKCPKTSSSLFKSFLCENISKNFETCTDCKNIDLLTKNKICLECKTGELVPFCTFDIISQIEIILSNPIYLDQIKNSNSHVSNDKIESALDGTIYSNLNLNEKDYITISLNINTDGAPLIKCLSYAMWPVIATVVELKQSVREKFDNIIFLGMWLHNSKPNYNIFFAKAFEQIKSLLNKINIIGNKRVRIRGQSGLLDLPAKASVCNVKQFNGEYGCVVCFHPGQRINRVNYYPFDKLYPLKTNQDYINFSAIADECNKNEPDEKKHQSFFGFFGEAPISKILKVPEEIPFDYMHLVLQGHAKWLFNNIFFNKNIFENQNEVGEKMLYVNKILSSVQMPHTINRKATNIENSSKWKSSEIKNFLFFESIPIFMNVFPSWYFYQYSAYVIAIRILYEPIINKIKLIILSKHEIKFQSGLHTAIKCGRRRPIECLPISEISIVQAAPKRYKKLPFVTFKHHLVLFTLKSDLSLQHCLLM